MGFRKTLYRIGAGIKKYSPQILAAAGTVSTIAGVLLACKASADSVEDIKEAHEEIDQIKDSMEKKAIEVKDGKKAIRMTKWKCVKKVGPRYLLAAGFVAGGLGALHASRKIVTYWLNGTTAYAISLENKYQALEDSVRREYGEEALYKLKYGVFDGNAEIRTTDDKNVEIASIQPFDDLVDVDRAEMFALIFDKSSNRHQTDWDHCLAFLNSAETTFTQMLHTNRVLNLYNDICKNLDIRPKDDKQLGIWMNTWWIYKPEDSEKDCYVSLRPRLLHDGNSKNTKTGFDPVILLDPNWDCVTLNGDLSEVYKYMR